MVTPEGKVKQKIDEWIKLHMPFAYVYKPAGGPFGKTGESDYHICWRGIFIAIEAKAGDNEPTSLQMSRLKAVRMAGGIAAVVTDIAEVYVRLPFIRQLVIDRTPDYVQPSPI